MSAQPADLLTARQLSDLAASGLTKETVEELRIRPAGNLELEACGLRVDDIGEGVPYVIPYFNINGHSAGHYRLKLLDNPNGQKYAQPRNSPNFIYFPPNFLQLAKKTKFVLVTEGEKKAAAAMQAGYAAIGLGGVDSWRSRTFEVSVESLKHLGSADSSRLTLRLSSGMSTSAVRELESGVSKGLPELTAFAKSQSKTLMIVFDTDLPRAPFIKAEVQRAAADLAHYFRVDGRLPLTAVKQVVLPISETATKVGLDDYLVEFGSEGLREVLHSVLDKSPGEVFPRRYDLVGWLTKQLNSPKLGRALIEKIVLSVLAELDARGRRLRAPNNRFYYFDAETNVVLPVAFVGAQERFVADTVFSQYLYTDYGLRTRDAKILGGLLDAYTAEEPFEDVEPHRGLRTTESGVDHQLDDHKLARVTASGIVIADNGSEGTLFLADQVDPLPITQPDIDSFRVTHRQLEPWWLKILEDARLDAIEGLSLDETRELIACLFYISPWLNRWRGTQLPLEIACAEAGSGKSSIYALRLKIITGKPELQNVPNDLRDWYAAVSSAPGIWVGDNVRFANRDARQRISDELCRLTTEPEPHVTLRRLYTTSERARIPINTVFAITSIYPPFQSADVQQRSIMLRFSAIPEGERLGNWVETQLERFGGRAAWVMQHLDAVHRFMKLAQDLWDPNYRSHHRLANLEQCLVLMAQAVNLSLVTPETLARFSKHSSMVADDTTMEGLIEFAKDQVVLQEFAVSDIVTWAQASNDYEGDLMLSNARRLGRYIKAHEYDVKKLTGITARRRYGNRALYHIERSKEEE